MTNNITNSCRSILAMLFTLLTLPVMGADEYSIAIGGIDYVLNEDETASVEGAESSIKIEIPETVVYENKTYSVTTISGGAFSECTSLESVTIPKTVTYIGNSAFRGCTSLNNIVIPNSVTSTGYQSFLGCTSLTSIEIPSSMTNIAPQAFQNCTGLTDVKIPGSVTGIGDEAFKDCTSLTGVEISDSVTYIGACAFGGCTSLTNLGVTDNNPSYTLKEGVLFNKELTELIQYLSAKQDKEYVIPSSVTKIGEGAFRGCANLVSVVIPSSVTAIESGAFYGCTGLTGVVIPESVTEIEKSTFQGCTSLESVEIPSTVTYIGSSAFQGCASLNSVKIPEGVESIKNYTFYGCSNLKEVEIPSTVWLVDYQSFYGCTNLKAVTCKAVNPPYVMLSGIFSSESYANCQLFVPDESVDSYKSSLKEWYKFENINAISEYVAIESLKASSAMNRPTVYHLNGTVVSGDVQSLSSGIYIIKEGGKSRKVIIR